MRDITRAQAALALAAAAALALAATAVARTGSPTRTAAKPIVIGAVVDLTKGMAPFDAPALLAAQIQIKAINAKGGVNGRPLKLISLNDQLDPAKTKQDAVRLLAKKVDIGWVTCDVNYASPAAQEFLNAGKLTIAPCLGTDELSPIRFGAKGKLGFSYGNAAQDEGAAAAEYAYKVKHWKSADIVTDNLLRYFQDVCKAFTVRFTQLGGKIVAQEQFKQFKNQINNVVSRVNNEKADVIAFCTSFGVDQPAFAGHAAQTGGFLGGAAAIQGIARAVGLAHGSTNGAKLARIMVKFHRIPTISGKVSFSAGLHTVFGRAYRVILVNDNKAKYVASITASAPAKIGR